MDLAWMDTNHQVPYGMKFLILVSLAKTFILEACKLLQIPKLNVHVKNLKIFQRPLLFQQLVMIGGKIR